MTSPTLTEIKARLETATVPPGAFDILYRMGYDSEKEPYCQLIAHAPTDLAFLLALVERQQRALECADGALKQYGPVGYAEKALAEVARILAGGE